MGFDSRTSCAVGDSFTALLKSNEEAWLLHFFFFISEWIGLALPNISGPFFISLIRHMGADWAFREESSPTCAINRLLLCPFHIQSVVFVIRRGDCQLISRSALSGCLWHTHTRTKDIASIGKKNHSVCKPHKTLKLEPLWCMRLDPLLPWADH